MKAIQEAVLAMNLKYEVNKHFRYLKIYRYLKNIGEGPKYNDFRISTRLKRNLFDKTNHQFSIKSIQ